MHELECPLNCRTHLMFNYRNFPQSSHKDFCPCRSCCLNLLRKQNQIICNIDKISF